MDNNILPLPTFITYSLGCRTNQSEIENISSQLIAYGFVQYNLCGSAALKLCCYPSVVLLNTCVVTAKAEKETRQKIRELKKKYPESFLVVLGCGVTAKEKFNIKLPEADLYISNKDKNKTAEIICSARSFLAMARRDLANYHAAPNKYHLSGRKFIKIQDGCDKYCTFCITCHLRGKPTSVSSEKIVKEINFWVENGIKEVILTGINIGLWGRNFRKQESVNSLVEKILSETKFERLSFSSIYPEIITDEFIKLVVNNSRISQYFHLSLQSGSQSVLERMNRKTDLSRLLKIIKQIKANNPLFTFRADIITGFPNETEEEFQETLDFIKEVKISFAHVFTYSKRKGTAAYSLSDLPAIIKKERVKKIKEVVKEVQNSQAKNLIAKLLNCLIVRERRSNWEGITENGIKIMVKPSFAKATAGKQELSIKGTIVQIKVTGFEKDYLLGEIIPLPVN